MEQYKTEQNRKSWRETSLYDFKQSKIYLVLIIVHIEWINKVLPYSTGNYSQ